jgi:hypothetical protein
MEASMQRYCHSGLGKGREEGREGCEKWARLCRAQSCHPRYETDKKNEEEMMPHYPL